MDNSANLYDADFYAWSNRQAALLRAGKFSAADIDLIAQEIETMGKSEKRELVNRLKILLLHLLKWQYQPLGRSASWQATVRIQRLELEDHLADNPSLKAKWPEAVASAYRIAIVAAAEETKMPASTFPPQCPFALARLMQEDYWPEA